MAYIKDIILSLVLWECGRILRMLSYCESESGRIKHYANGLLFY